MPISKLLAVALLPLASAVLAAPPAYITIDHSTAAVMDKAQALAVWREQFDAKRVARLNKLYPVAKWGFISQVEGGYTADKTCVVTARVMLVPRSFKRLLFAPHKTATAFDAQPNLPQDPCRALARAKLGEAISAVLSSLVATN